MTHGRREYRNPGIRPPRSRFSEICSKALICRRIALWCWCTSRRADATCHARQPTNHETARCFRTKCNVLGFSISSRSKPRPFALLCGVSLVSQLCGSKPLLQLTAGTERACGSVLLVIRPQAKHRVRALSRVHITSQRPRPSLCREHTAGVLGALGTKKTRFGAWKVELISSSTV